MDKIKDVLKNIGLTETESTIYLAGLPYDCVGVSELEKQTGVKRTTIYHAMNTLMQKGLASKKGTESKFVFSMTRPNNIRRMIDGEIDKLKDKKSEVLKIIPLLNEQVSKKEESFKISHYEGAEGVKLVVDEALYCKSRQWDIIAPYKNFFSEFDKKYARYFMDTRNSNGIKTRSLWENGTGWRALSIHDINTRNPRFLPNEMTEKFKSVIIIFDDKVAIISSAKELSAVLIQSGETHETFEAMFEGLWSVSMGYREAKNKT
ncbi:TrmB family transcriptional regulator [Patescibacteria group bacterium]